MIFNRSDVLMTDRNQTASSHFAVMKKAESLLATALDDPFLADLAEDCSLENVQSQLALLQGKAITLYIKKFDDTEMCKFF